MFQSFLQVIHQRVVGRQFLTVHLHTHALVFRRDHQRLLAHPSHHVQGLLRFPVPRHFPYVERHAAFDRGAFLLVDREEPVCRAKPAKALVRPPMVVVLHPPGEALPRLLERLEARLHQELPLERGPQPLDLPQRLRVLGRAAEVMDVILLQFLLEPGFPAPDGVLPAVVGQHLLGYAVLPHRLAVDLQHVLRGLAAIQPQPHDVPGEVIQEGDDVGHLPQDAEVRDVALPQLIRRGALEPAWRRFSPVAKLFRRLQQPFDGEFLTHLLRAGPQTEPAPQRLRDPPHAPLGCGALDHTDLLPDRLGQLPRRRSRPRILQPGHAVLPIELDPVPHRLARHTKFPAHRICRDSLLQMQLHGSLPHLHWVRWWSMMPPRFGLPRPLFLGLGIRERTAAPPGGRLPLRPLFLLLRFHR
jgi:hypothetical protein